MNTNDQHTAKCLRPGCGRKLTSAKSVACGYGPTCLRKVRIAAIEKAIAPFSARQQEKILAAIASGECEPAGPGAWKVPSSRNDGTKYRATTAWCPCESRILCCHIGTVRAIEAVAMLTRDSRNSEPKAA